jgi:hypothetical protein
LIQINEANQNQLDQWDEFVDRSVNGTIFHKRNFLAYHHGRFPDERFLVVQDGNHTVALMSMAIKTDRDRKFARSHYGASYGSFIFEKPPSYSLGKNIVSTLVSYLKSQGIDSFSLTPPIAACSSVCTDVFTYNLLEQGFVSVNRDISTVAVLQKDVPIMDQITSRARNMIRKAQSEGITVERESNVNRFWSVLEATFRKHGASATHTANELQDLMTRFPHDITVDVAYHEGRAVAGLTAFAANSRVNSSFYLCQDPECQHLQALSLIVLRGLEGSQQHGFRYFDFGTSSVNMQARENVFRFKESFTKIGMFRETFEWKNQHA